MGHESAGQFDRAAKKSIKDSGRDPGVAYKEMLRDRFLCRIFSEDDPHFLLKGGSGMLARIPDARATKDFDFAARRRETAESALAALDSRKAQRKIQSRKHMRRGAAECATAPTTFAHLR